MISTRQLRYFEALATTLHFGKAAEMVHVSQPALSAQIMEMERYLGVKLVERTRSSTLLTDKGEEVLQHARTVLAALDQLEEAARRSSGTLEGLLRLGIIPTVAPYLVPKMVPHLRREHPLIEIELKEAVTDRLLADLVEGRLDAIIAAIPIDLDKVVLEVQPDENAVDANDNDPLKPKGDANSADNDDQKKIEEMLKK